MAKARDTSKFEERLQQLKTEEKLIRSVLEDVRKQLDRYEVERMHLSGLEFDTHSDDENSNLVIDEQSNQTPVNLDSASEINKKPVQLEFRSEFFYKNSEDDEEFDEDA